MVDSEVVSRQIVAVFQEETVFYDAVEVGEIQDQEQRDTRQDIYVFTSVTGSKYSVKPLKYFWKRLGTSGKSSRNMPNP